MAKEICISTTPHETRLAILEDDQLAEIYYERENEYTLAGSIYKGRVTRVLPGMQSSFVDVGLERDAFLYVTDFLEEQEDSEEFAGEGSRRPRPAAPHGEESEANGSEHGGLERNGLDRNNGERPERGERNGGRAELRNTDRPADRSQEDRGGRRGSQQSSESSRAGRERAREQAAAPLREAVPAAQDLEEKGDEDSPAGTRRWRGRRVRRRGVRSSSGDAHASQPGQSVTPQLRQSEAPEPTLHTEEADDNFPDTFSTPERGAPGGIADLHASPAIEDATEFRAAPTEPRASDSRTDRGLDRGRGRNQDRGGRRSREPYAQASTLDRSDRGSREAAAIASAPTSGGAIVLPGESLSKYGSAPAQADAAPASATVPRPAARPVNYVAPKPSTLVELSGDWDGGAVLPGETLSLYRGPSSVPSSSSSGSSAHPSADLSHESAPAPTQTNDAEYSWSETRSDSEPPPPTTEQEPPVKSDSEPPFPPVTEQELPAEPGLDQIDAAGAHAPDPQPLAEPEVMAAAVSPDSEAPRAHVPEPVIAQTSEETEPAQTLAPSEAAEYEPESGSASYRVGPTGSGELRLASPEAEQISDSEREPDHAAPYRSPSSAFDHEEPGNTLHDLAGEFPGQGHDDAEQRPHSAQGHMESADLGSPGPEPVPEFQGALAGADAVFHAAAAETYPLASEELSVEDPASLRSGSVAPFDAPDHPHADDRSWSAHPLSILHEDGTIEVLPAQTPAPASPPEISFAEPAPGSIPEFPEGHGFEPEAQQLDSAALAQEAELSSAAASMTPFADLVDRMQGFAPGNGLLEEEVLDEEEYDFDPVHAHSHPDEGDQEDLEEETLDNRLEPSTLSDAVRDSHLEQRVHQQPDTPEDLRTEEPSLPLGYAEVEPDLDHDQERDEDEGDEEDEPQEAAGATQAGEPARSGRAEDRARTRGRGGARNAGRGGRNGGRGRSAQVQDLPIISDMLKQGQEILVQIAKEPIAKKGARITSHIALPGRFLVFMPTVSHVGVSRKIASDEERQRLKRILISEKGESSGGFIVRTAAEGATEEDLRADLRFLISLWTEIKQRVDSAKAPALIYHDLNLIERILRDQVSSNFATIWVDSEGEYERIIRFLSRFQPQLVRRVKLYTKETPLFEHFGIQDEISKALKSKVWLKSGGSIVINQTEALVAIDINTGKYVGKTARLEDTIVKTNLDAIPEIVRQIRLRDLGGIIVIDFIDMDERKNRNRVLAALEEELKHDRAPSKVLQFNDFGLVAITRKRVKQSLERTLSVQCETCTGTGMVKSPVTVCNEIYIEMRKMQKHLDGKDVMLRVHPEVVKQLKAGNGKWINELEELVTKTIIIKSDPALHPEQFDIH